MPRHHITFTFLSPWHMGSGFGEGAHLDALPVKSAAGLPYIPGRSVKGLFREALLLAAECGQTEEETVVTLFGSRDEEQSRYETTPGKLSFTSATMGEAMEVWGSSGNNADALKQLFMPLASTQIDPDGLAHDRSLRKIEAALPVELTAVVEYEESGSGYHTLLATAASLIRQAGSHRHRGLGRVKVSVSEVLP